MEACVFLADGFETVEALAVVDVLKRVGVDVVTVSVTGSKSVVSSHDIVVVADMLFDEEACMASEMIFLPGGMPGTTNLENHYGVINVVKSFYEQGKMIAAICAAPSILGHLGFLEGRRATSHGSFTNHLKGAVVTDEPVVIDGSIITSRGMGTAVELGLTLAELLKGRDEAERISKAIHFN